MEGVRRRQPPATDAFAPRACAEGRDGSSGPETTHWPARSRPPRPDPGRAGAARPPRPGERPASTRPACSAPAGRVGDQPSASIEREHAGQAGGDVLADAVAEHRRRPHAPAIQNWASAYSTANNAGCVTAVCQQCGPRRLLRPAAREEHVAQIEAEMRTEQLGTLIAVSRKTGSASIQARAPCRRTGPWPGNRNATGGLAEPCRR